MTFALGVLVSLLASVGMRSRLKSEADALTTGLPVDFGLKVGFTMSTDFGAVLMCDDKVVAEGYDHRQTFLKWIKMNAKTLSAQFPDVKEYGISAVTWTYSASEIYINAWEDPKKEVVLGFKVGMTGVGSLNPETTWARSQYSTGWSRYDDQKRVVFFTGVKIKFGWLGLAEEREPHWRGSGEDFLAETGDGRVAEVLVEYIGDNWDDIMEDEEQEED